MGPQQPTSILEAGELRLPPGADLAIHGADPVLASRHHVGEASATAAACAAAWAARFGELRGLPRQSVGVDVQAAAATLLGFLLQSAERAPSLGRDFSPVTGLFRSADGRLIHLHGGFRHLAEGTGRVLACPLEPDALAGAVAKWRAADLEDALAAAGLCGAIVRSPDEWAEHPQGQALAGVSAVSLRRLRGPDAAPAAPSPADRPLAGVRVLDLTRVLAGPTVGRTLAAHGADVLRIDGPRLPFIEVFAIETGRGKRSALCDLDDPADRARLQDLVGSADVVVQGYRLGALDARGLGAERLAARRPGIVVVRVSCYGTTGPWAERRGWEQLAQSTSGIAWSEDPDQPHLIPAAATDYTTGYLGAAGAAEALCRRAEQGGSWLVDVSLCQTAAWLGRLRADLDPAAAVGLGDVAARQETWPSAWGALTQLGPIEQLSHTPPRWDAAAVPRGSSPLAWRD